MNTLILMRHAKSDWSQQLDDRERPLNPRGCRTAPLMGQWLRDNVSLPMDISCRVSTARRARQTFALAMPDHKAFYDSRLYLASAISLDVLIRGYAQSHAHLLLVGHNDGMAQWVAAASEYAIVDFPTAAVAVFTRRRAKYDARWELQAHATPKMIQ